MQAEAERNRASNQNDDYTSLYWDPEAAGGRAGAKSENEYEVKKKTLIMLFFLLSCFLITFFLNFRLSKTIVDILVADF